MRVIFVRHGETGLNRIGGHFQGQIDIPITNLNEEGIRQAKEAGEEFRKKGIEFDLVYTSPQERAVLTAALITGKEKTEMIPDERLKELNFGPFEGKRWEEMPAGRFAAMMNDAEYYFPGAGAETIYHLVGRVSQFLQELLKKQEEWKDKTILISTHGGTVRAMLVCLHLAGMKTFWQTPVGNCAWFELKPEAGRFVLAASETKAEKDLGVKQ